MTRLLSATFVAALGGAVACSVHPDLGATDGGLGTVASGGSGGSPDAAHDTSSAGAPDATPDGHDGHPADVAAPCAVCEVAYYFCAASESYDAIRVNAYDAGCNFVGFQSGQRLNCDPLELCWGTTCIPGTNDGGYLVFPVDGSTWSVVCNPAQ